MAVSLFDFYLSSHTSSMRQPLNMLLIMTVNPLSSGCHNTQPDTERFIGGPGSDFISGVAGLGSHCRHTRFHLSNALMLSNPRTKAYRPANKFNIRSRFTPH